MLPSHHLSTTTVCLDPRAKLVFQIPFFFQSEYSNRILIEKKHYIQVVKKKSAWCVSHNHQAKTACLPSPCHHFPNGNIHQRLINLNVAVEMCEYSYITQINVFSRCDGNCACRNLHKLYCGTL